MNCVIQCFYGFVQFLQDGRVGYALLRFVSPVPVALVGLSAAAMAANLGMGAGSMVFFWAQAESNGGQAEHGGVKVAEGVTFLMNYL